MAVNHNYCVIMGGGIGSRFWPSSRELKPKQFLDIFGTGRSLLQMTFDRISRLIPSEHIFIVTGEVYRDQVLEQLPRLAPEQVLLEPLRRNTAPCVAYACYHIQALDPDANIFVAPSDHLILEEEAFLETVSRALDFVSEHPYLATLGIKPSRPETGYGYIQIQTEEYREGIHQVKTFTEKPNREMAEVFFSSGEFLWNSGMFAWNVKTIMRALQEYLPDMSALFDEGMGVYGTAQERDFIHNSFPLCQSISIDYGVMEKAHNVCVLPLDCGWADLGTWGSIYELKDKEEQGNVTLGGRINYYESTGNIVYTDNPDRLIVLQGLEDCIVAESDRVILVCKKAEEQRIKQFMGIASQLYNKEYD